jgi:hypothetical protein
MRKIAQIFMVFSEKLNFNKAKNIFGWCQQTLLTTPNNVLHLHLKQNFLPIFWIFTEDEGDEIKSRLPFKIFSTLQNSLVPVAYIVVISRQPELFNRISKVEKTFIFRKTCSFCVCFHSVSKIYTERFLLQHESVSKSCFISLYGMMWLEFGNLENYISIF